MMTPAQAENLDIAILRVLDLNAGRQFGLGVVAIRGHLPAHGHSEDANTINARLAYLSDSEIGFVTRADKGQFHPSNATWKITARGINHLRSIGL